MTDTLITIIGNLTADPDCGSRRPGAAVANFTVASTPRTFDKQANEWKDGEALFMRCQVWREAAENVAESLSRGSRSSSPASSSPAPSRLGREKRTVIELEVDEIGPSLRYATATVNKANRGGAGSSRASGGITADPWGAPQAHSDYALAGKPTATNRRSERTP